MQLYLVHSSRPSAFPPLHPLPLHLTFHSCIFLFRTRVEIYHFSHSFRGYLSFLLVFYFVEFMLAYLDMVFQPQELFIRKFMLTNE